MLDPAVSARVVADRRRIVVVGASGWIGRCSVDDLAQALGEDFAGRVVCVGSTSRSLSLRGNRQVPQISLDDLAGLEPEPSLVLHYAFLTKDRAEAMSDEDYREANYRIGETVVAALDKIGAEAVFVASSGAAYRANDRQASPAMRLYGELKVRDEQRFERWAHETGKRVVIARLFNVSGPYINKHQAYALASFILDALAGRTIAVKAPRRVVRGYVAISEVVSLALATMMAEPSGVVRFDTGGMPFELGDVARAVAARFENIDVHRAAIEEDISDTYHGDDRVYREFIKSFKISHLELPVQIAKTIDYLSGQQ